MVWLPTAISAPACLTLINWDGTEGGERGFFGFGGDGRGG